MNKNLDKNIIAQILRRELPYLREQYGVEKIALYGSFVRGNTSPESDVDLLVQLAKPLGFEFVDLGFYLEERLGRKVDLATFNALGRSLQDPVRKEIAAEIEKALVYV